MLAYYPGCSMAGSGREFGISSEVLLKRLKVEYRELEDWNCCGASAIHAYHENLSLAIPYRNLVLAEKISDTLVTPCSGCSNRLKSAHYWFNESPEKRDWLLENTGLTYSGHLQVEHLAGFLMYPDIRKKIQEGLKFSLKRLKVAVYYGCMVTRPYEITKFDDPNNPSRIEEFLALLGANSIDWPYKTECCGNTFSVSRRDLAYQLCFKILDSAKRLGADCIVTVCPLCQNNLDLRQPGIEKKYRREFDMPILYLSQLVGLAIGIPHEELALSIQTVDPMRMVKEKILA